MEKRVSVTVTGRVQGVGYRYHVTECAGELGILGYVTNNPDGTVTVVAEGEESTLQVFIETLHAPFNRYIKVNDVSVAWETARQEFRGFSIRR